MEEQKKVLIELGISIEDFSLGCFEGPSGFEIYVDFHSNDAENIVRKVAVAEGVNMSEFLRRLGMNWR